MRVESARFVVLSLLAFVAACGPARSRSVSLWDAGDEPPIGAGGTRTGAGGARSGGSPAANGGTLGAGSGGMAAMGSGGAAGVMSGSGGASAGGMIASGGSPVAGMGGSGAGGVAARDMADAPDVQVTRDTLVFRDAYRDVVAPTPDMMGRVKIAASGLVAFWSFDDGNGVRDTSPNMNTGQLVGGATIVSSGKRGGGIKLGGSAYVRVPKSGSIDGISSGLTIAAWANHVPNAGDGVQGIVTRQEGTEQSDKFGLWTTRGGDLRLVLGGQPGVTANGRLIANTWVHVAGVWNGTQVQLFVNGTLVASGADSEPLIVGGSLNGPNDPAILSFEGTLDEIGIWNRALTAAEIAALAVP